MCDQPDFTHALLNSGKADLLIFAFLLQTKFQTLMILVCHMSARSMVFAGCLKMVTLCANASQTALTSMIRFVGQTERTTLVIVF